MSKKDWERLIYQLRTGHCTPFVGAGASMSVLPSGRRLSKTLAAKCDYPGPETSELPRVAQYASFEYGDLSHVKYLVRDELTKDDRTPDFSDQNEPHAVLADFPLPVYLTTNYDDFIVQALATRRKAARAAVCPWNEAIAPDPLFKDAEGWNPSPQTPLVYHLHGAMRDPATFVLAEDDYMMFLRNLAIERKIGGNRMFPPSILAALTTRPLLFIGYSLQDWTTRAMFAELGRSIPALSRRRHVSVQLAPGDASGWTVEDLERQLSWYYREWQITVYWGGIEDFCTELRDRMGAMS
ncbi:SIR2 family NAD-dependent protein deacylase [Herbidospora yilanensis]|uniref:SIR2 family NAD-dependent protein deacylase n=1 Tax=Herbidospora yilanensis TaxID=354426 RepID=UPI0018DC5BEC|nr:SIR2 family protein [Herbidospora yilanensis]